jgi:copper chaperone CopZ
MPEIKVKGMSCPHCAGAVTRALESLPGVTKVKVDLTTGQVTYESAAPVPREDLTRAITAAGYEVAD